MWVELGIVGLFFMMAAIISQLRSVRTWTRKFAEERDPHLLAVESACLGVLASGLFLDIVWTKAFWLPWILLAFYTRIRKRNSVTARS
jgi:O-antigen ligase